MTHITVAGDSASLAWFKSSYSSSGDGNDCLEIAITPGNAVHVRDSKNTAGPSLTLRPDAWTSFVTYAAERPEH